MPTITIVDKPVPTSTSQSQSNADSKARAIALLTGHSSQAQATPAQVANQNSISPEEMSAVKTSETQEEAVQADTSEVTPDTASKEEAPLSTQYAVLARKEKALRAKVIAQEQQFKQREAALNARETELSSKSTQDLTNYISKDKLKQNALGVLAELGIDYDQISQQALAASSPEAQAFRQYKQEMDAELQKVREEQANTRKSYEQQQTQAYQQALTQIRNEAKALVSADPAFEMTKETGSINDVVDLIERTFKEEGTLLTVEQAAQAVEDHLVEEAMKISKIKKIQERLKPVQKPTAAQSQATGAPQQSPSAQPQAQMKTLTNAVGSTRPLTAKERALLAFKGELVK